MLKTGFMDDEKLFTVELIESELCQVVTALWRLERENVALASAPKGKVT